MADVPITADDAVAWATLHAVLETSNLDDAAIALHLSVADVRAHLETTRGWLGDPLVHGADDALQPTPLADRLAPSLRDAMHQLDALVAHTRFDPATDTRTFRLAMDGLTASVFLPVLTLLLAAEAPHVGVGVRETDADADLTLTSAPSDERGEGRPLPGGPWTWSLLAGPAHGGVLPELTHATYARFTGRRLWAPEAVLDEALRQAGVHRLVRVETDDAATLIACLTTSPHLAVLPRPLAVHVAERCGASTHALPWDVPCPAPELRMRLHGEADAGVRWLLDRVVDAAWMLTQP